jgi:ankyrin repeat protein
MNSVKKIAHPEKVIPFLCVCIVFVCHQHPAWAQNNGGRPPDSLPSPDNAVPWALEEESPAGDPQSNIYELVKTGSAPQVVEAIKQGADVNSRDAQGRTPLMIAAAFSKDPMVIVALLKHGASANERSEHGFSPLIFAAASNESPDVVRVVLQGGAVLNAKNEFGRTALFYACQRNPNPDIVRTLVDAGANVNGSDDLGETPLMMAAMNRNSPESIVLMLLRAGADGSARTRDGKTAFDYARENSKLRDTTTYWKLNDSQY